MSWIQKLYETYNNCQSMIGVEENDRGVPLLPICHTTQKAQIEIVLDHEGNFRRAKVISKDEARTIIPCTEKSGGRTSGEAPHPLCDKLQYIAQDYRKYGGRKKPYSASYIAQLGEWCSSAYFDPKLLVVLKYVKKGHVVGDLIDHQTLVTGKNGKLLPKWDKKKGEETPRIFEVLTAQTLQNDAFIRWVVEIPGEEESKTWKDKVLWEKWIDYYTGTKTKKSLCYVAGEDLLSADQHLAKLRSDGDKAKLISSNDTSGYTFRGRLITDAQAASVGFEVTQKAHLALRWLISRQGYKKRDLAIVAWATSGIPVPQPTDDPLAFLLPADLPTETSSTIATAQEVAVRLKKRIAGYGKDIGNAETIVVMGLDSATTGRLAITFYRELTGSDFLNRLNSWHESGAWFHNYKIIDKKRISFIGAPAPHDIAEAAYGSRLDDKLRNATVERILPCIIDGQPIPRDLVESAVRRSSNRVGIKNPDDKKYYGDGEYTWKKTLSIACALFNKYNKKENYEMALDPNRKTRDYLYGRLLALADSLEEWALNEANEKRETNAARLMQRFAEHPYSTWRTLELSLSPYKARLGGKSKKRQQMIDEVVASFDPEDFLSDKRLSGEFLLGYHSQREFLRSSRKKTTDPDIENSETSTTIEQGERK